MMNLYYQDGYAETRQITFLAEDRFGFIRCRDRNVEVTLHFLALRTDGGKIPTLPELRALAKVNGGHENGS